MNISFQLVFILYLIGLNCYKILSTCEKAGYSSLTINGIPNKDILNKLKEKRIQVTFFLNESIQNDNKFILSKAIKDGHEIGILPQQIKGKFNIQNFNKIIFNIKSTLGIEPKYIKLMGIHRDLELIKSLNDIEYLVINDEIVNNLNQTNNDMRIKDKLIEILQNKDLTQDKPIYSISLTPSITSEDISSFIEIIRQNGLRLMSLSKCLNQKEYKKNLPKFKSHNLNYINITNKVKDINISNSELDQGPNLSKRTDMLFISNKDNQIPKLTKPDPPNAILPINKYDSKQTGTIHVFDNEGSSSNGYKLSTIHLRNSIRLPHMRREENLISKSILNPTTFDNKALVRNSRYFNQRDDTSIFNIDASILKHNKKIPKATQNSVNIVNGINIKDNIQLFTFKNKSNLHNKWNIMRRNENIGISSSNFGAQNIGTISYRVPVNLDIGKQHIPPKVIYNSEIVNQYQRRNQIAEFIS